MATNYKRFSRKAYAGRINDLADELDHWYRVYDQDAQLVGKATSYPSRALTALNRRNELVSAILLLREAASTVYALD